MSRDSTDSDWELVAAVSLLDGWNMRNFGAVLPNVDNESLETTQQRVITWLKQCIRSYLRVTGTVVSLHSSGEAGEFWLAHEEWVPDK
jgi:hypothetical protein